MITTYEARGEWYSKRSHKIEVSSSLWNTEEKAEIMARQYRLMGFVNVTVTKQEPTNQNLVESIFGNLVE